MLLVRPHDKSGHVDSKAFSNSQTTLVLDPSAWSSQVLLAICSDHSNIYSTNP
jgi:hypothetical protein